MVKNEIFYSLSKYEIQAIKKNIETKISSQYLHITIVFNSIELNKIYKLLSNLYTISDKDAVEEAIWETFICNKIIKELDKNELIYYQHDIKKEDKILNSYNLKQFIQSINNRSNIERVSQIIKNQISKNVIIHYFQDEVIIPLELQKFLNSIFISKLPFINILYTTKSSLNSYYKRNGYWIKKKNTDVEVWKTMSLLEEKANF